LRFILVEVASTGTALACFLIGRHVFRRYLYVRHGNPVLDLDHYNFLTIGLLLLPVISHLGIAIMMPPLERSFAFSLFTDVVLQPAMFVLGLAAGRRGLSIAGGMIIVEVAAAAFGAGFWETSGIVTLFSSDAVESTFLSPGALATMFERIDDFGLAVFGWVLARRLRAYHPKASSFAEALSLLNRPVRLSRPFPLLISRGLAVTVTIAMVLMQVVPILLSTSLPQPGKSSGLPVQDPIIQEQSPPERLRASTSRE
jgi:hypothetical protein